jgi:tetratricopeptide (TPR) repeat protein
MAPEQREGTTIDARADQYSFCVALWEAIVGAHPHEGAPASNARMPRRVRAALRRGLDPEPAVRWPSMDALLAELAHDPARRGLQITAALLVVAAVGAGAFVAWGRADAPARACRAAAAQALSEWGEPERAAVRAAFAQTGAADAGEAAAAALQVLDGYAGDVAAAVGSACVAAHVTGAETEADYALRRACLTRRRDEMRALVRELVHPDVVLVGRAADAAAALPPVAECADVEALAAPTRLPSNAAQRPAVAALRGELDAIEALFLAGKYKDALVRDVAAVALARAVGFQPLVAEALRVLGRCYNKLDRLADAEPVLGEAVYTALAAGHDGEAVTAIIDVLQSVGYDGRRLGEARAWGRLAQATAARLGTSSQAEEVRASVEKGLAAMENRGESYAAGEEHGRRAVAALERLAPGSRRLADALGALAWAVSARGRYAEALELYRRQLAIETALHVAPDTLASCENNIGGAQRLLHDYAAASAALERAFALTASSIGPDSLLMASIEHNLGAVDMELERFDAAHRSYRHARAIFAARLGPDSPKVAKALTNEGALYLRELRFAEARAAYEQALAIDERTLGTDDPGLAWVVSNLSGIAVRERRFKDAVHLAERAIALARKADPNGAGTAWAMRSVARAYGDRPRDALAAYLRALPVYERAFGPSSADTALLLGEIGALEDELGDDAAARATLERAMAMAPDAVESKPYLRLGQIYVRAGAFERAQPLLEAARDGFVRDGADKDAAEAAAWLARLDSARKATTAHPR